jgi:DNA-binding NarL/FixJ family response regulator
MPVPFPARVLIADDHAVVRAGLRALLDAQPDLKVVAEAKDGAEAVAQALRQHVDLAVLDVSMPRLNGLQATLELSRRRPQIRVLLLSMYDREQYLFEAVDAGASGYVLKQQADRDLVESCREVLRSRRFVCPPSLRARLDSHLARARRTAPIWPGNLTTREVEIVKLIAEGHSSHEIAEMLVLSIKTVEHHRSNILEKLKLRNTAELTRFAIREGLLES